MALVLDLCDLQITLCDEQGQLVYQQPAAIAWHEGQYLFGRDAVMLSRSNPQQFNQRYLSTLSSQPLPGPLGSALNHADLTYQHLQSLSLAGKKTMLCVPSHWTNEQLGLLLGICNELQIEITGFADNALVQLLKVPGDEDIAVLDLELQRLTLTRCSRAHDQLTVLDHRVWDGRGYLHLLEGWMSLVADEYVQRTRFDPLHSGAAEQQLLNQLTSWISHHRPGDDTQSLRATIERGGEPHEIEIQAQLLIEKVQQRMLGIDLADANVALTSRVQALPGLPEWISAHARSTTLLPDQQALVQNYDYLAAKLPTDSITRLTSVAHGTIASESSTDPTDRAGAGKALATHLLADHQACTFQSVGLVSTAEGLVHNSGERWQINGTDAAPEGSKLRPGDRVTIDNTSYVAITVVG